jgi:hypothetical protein
MKKERKILFHNEIPDKDFGFFHARKLKNLNVKKQESISNGVNNIKTRSADIKIQFNINNYTPGCT